VPSTILRSQTALRQGRPPWELSPNRFPVSSNTSTTRKRVSLQQTPGLTHLLALRACIEKLFRDCSLVPTLAWIMHVLRPRHLATSEPPDIVACHVRRALRGQIVVSTAKSIHRLGKKLLAYAIRTNSSMPWDLRSERRGKPKNLQIFPTRFCLRFSIRHIGPTTFPAESKRMQHSPLATRHSPLATRHWSLVIGHWSLVIGHWSLVIGHWSLVIGHWSAVSGQRSAVWQSPIPNSHPQA
jgi:hypothetical protein